MKIIIQWFKNLMLKLFKKKVVSTRRELTILHRVGFCKNCFNKRRNSSAYCGECREMPERMKIYQADQHEFPFLDKVVKKFKFTPKELERKIFTYGDTIYFNGDLSYGIQAHEIAHVFQQTKMGAKDWWKQYLKDDKFRMEQELEAYQKQYQVYREHGQVEYLSVLARDLSGSMYGKITNFSEAKMLIEKGV